MSGCMKRVWLNYVAVHPGVRDDEDHRSVEEDRQEIAAVGPIVDEWDRAVLPVVAQHHLASDLKISFLREHPFHLAS